MTKQAYLAQLKRLLKRLPHEEYNEAIRYYEEFFAESEGENAPIETLGTPQQAAAKILAEFASNSEKRTNISKIWLIILAFFSFPITIPLAVGALIIAIAAFVVIIAFFGAGLAIGVAGFAVFIFAFALAIQNFPTMLLVLGMGIFCFAIGAVIVKAAIILIQLTARGLSNLFAKIMRRYAK